MSRLVDEADIASFTSAVDLWASFLKEVFEDRPDVTVFDECVQLVYFLLMSF